MRKLLLIGTLLFGWTSAALAADSSVPNMTAGAAMSDTDLLYCAQSSGTTDRKCTAAQIKTYANTSAVDARTTTSEAVATSDQNKLVTFTNASAVAATIAQATSGTFFNGWAVALKNLGAGAVTLTPTTSTIDGASTLVLTTGQGVDLYSDGTNYFTQPGMGSGGVTTTGSPASGNLAKFSGATAITSGDLSGDCTTSGTLATNCLVAPVPQYIAGNWFVEWGNGGVTATTNAPSGNTAYFSPLWFPKKITIEAVEIAVNTLSATNNCQVGIYAPDVTTTNRPGALVASSGNISVAATGVVSAALLSNAQLGPGLYFRGIVCSGGTPAFSGTSATAFPSNQLIGSSTGSKVLAGASNSNLLELSVAITFASGASWPSSVSPSGSTCGSGASACTYTELTGQIHGPLIAYQVLSIP